MADVLFVSKPVEPPWNDSSKNLVRELALAMTRHQPVVLGRREGAFSLQRGRVERPYSATAGGFAPGLSDNGMVFGRLMLGRRTDLWHFFFAPNPRSSRAARLAATVRRVPTVQTVCSAPRSNADISSLLFADRTVVLSAHTERRLLRSGASPSRVARIAPAIVPLDVPTEPARRRARTTLSLSPSQPVLVYPGDLEFGSGASLTINAFAALQRSDAQLVMACRVKTERARQEERRLRLLATQRGVAERVMFVGETRSIHSLLGTADVVVLPSESLYAKMDHPLALLEAMSMERPVIVAAGTPAAELADNGAALAVAPETSALSATIDELLSDERLRAEVGRAGRERVLSVHDPARMARRYEALYDELL